MSQKRSRQERSLAKERRAVHLRLVGQLSYSQIAASLLPCPAHHPNGAVGCELCERLYANAGGACRAIQRAMLRDYPPPTPEQRTKYVAEQQATISLLLSRMIRDALDPTAGPADRARASNEVVKLLRRQAVLLGLDAEARGEADDHLDAEIQRLLDELGVQ